MECSTLGFPVLHHLLELAQTHVRWIGDTIQPSCPLSPFSSCLQSFLASGSFLVSQLFVSGDQSIGALVSASVLPMNSQGWSPLGWTGWISLQSKGLSRVFSNTTVQSINSSILWCSAFFMVQLSHLYMNTGKAIPLTRRTFVGKVVSLLFNMLSTLVIAFLPRSKCLLISWLQSPSSVILEAKKIKSVTISTFSSSICHEVMGPAAMIFVFGILSFKPAFSLFSFTFIINFSSSLLSAIGLVSSAYLILLIFLWAILIPACDLSSPAFHTMYSAYKLHKQGGNIQPCYTPFPIWNQSVVPCLVLTVAFLKEEIDRTGSILKAGLHLVLDCVLWVICPVSVETTYQLENQTRRMEEPQWLYLDSLSPKRIP